MDMDDSLQSSVEILNKAKSAIFIGRGISSPLVKEGALKMMEDARWKSWGLDLNVGIGGFTAPAAPRTFRNIWQQLLTKLSNVG